jgi:hypothetical protein
MNLAEALFDLADLAEAVEKHSGAAARVVLQVSRATFDEVEADPELFGERSGPVSFAVAHDGPVKQLPLFEGLVVVECPAQVNRSRVGSGTFTMDLS